MICICYKFCDVIFLVDEFLFVVFCINFVFWEDFFVLVFGEDMFVEEEMVFMFIVGYNSLGNFQIFNNLGLILVSDVVLENGEEELFVEIEECGDDKMRKIVKSLRFGDMVEEVYVSVDLFIF